MSATHVKRAFLLAGFAASTAFAHPPVYDQWVTFNVKDGIPSDKVFCVYAADDFVWIGTDNGAARYDGVGWRILSPKDGLAHQAVLGIARDPDSGDMWFATMGGLSRYSGGRMDTFTQLNSGLANNVVYGVTVQNGEVWAATAAGASQYEIAADRWTIHDDTNSPMHEIWCYSVAGDGKRIYLGVWGGGLLEWNPARRRWKDYRDPDGEMEIDLFRDDGLVHDILTGVACDRNGIVWAGSYFGLSSYDGRKWRNFLDHDSPLISNFINAVTAEGDFCWIATDDGLNATNRTDWWSYRRDEKTGHGVVVWTPHRGEAETIKTDSIFPHNYVLGVALQKNAIWVATAKGVSRGTSGGMRTAAVQDVTPISKANKALKR